MITQTKTYFDRTPKWNAVTTRSRHEMKVEEHLCRLQIEHYLPKHETLRVWSDRKRKVWMPLFPGYIFVKVNCRNYEQVLFHPSVGNFLKCNGGPTPIREKVIEAIRIMLNEKVDFTVYNHGFDQGDKVLITSGVLAGYEAEVVNLMGKRQLVLSIDGMCQKLIILTGCQVTHL